MESRLAVAAAPLQNPLSGVDGVPSTHITSSPLGLRGQPPPLHRPVFAAPVPQLQLALKSTHHRSPVKLDEVQAPFVPQSASFRQGSQVCPVPEHFPKRCAQVACPSSGSQTPHAAAFPQGQEGCFGSHNWVQILAPLLSWAQIWFGTARQSASVLQALQNSLARQALRVTPRRPHWYARPVPIWSLGMHERSLGFPFSPGQASAAHGGRVSGMQAKPGAQLLSSSQSVVQ